MSLDPLKLNLVGEEGPAGGDECCPCLQEGTAGRPTTCDLVDRAKTVRVDCTTEMKGVEYLESGVNGQKFRYLSSAPKGMENRGDFKANSEYIGAPIRDVGREERAPRPWWDPSSPNTAWTWGGVQSPPAGIGVDRPGGSPTDKRAESTHVWQGDSVRLGVSGNSVHAQSLRCITVSSASAK